MTRSSSWPLVLRLLAEQSLGVLATNRRGHPYASLVAFAASDDLRCLYFATTRATRKFHNLAEDAQTALLIDNRHNQAHDFYAAAAVTAYGPALEIEVPERTAIESLYLARHPQLKTFVTAPSSALFRIMVEKYDLVERFQQVTEFRMSAWPS